MAVTVDPSLARRRLAGWAEILDLGYAMAYEALLAQTGDAEAAKKELRARFRREDAERRKAKERVLDGLARAP